MSRVKSDIFTINGKPFLAPDADVAVSYEDIDSEESGRDEAGFMHRVVVRYKVGTWSFEFSHITEEEKQYMESLFPDAPDFQFGHPSRRDASITEVTTAYRSRYGISWQNARTGAWRNYKFNIIEC